jgi:hypothetical protein
MFRKKQEPPPPDFTVSEFLALDKTLSDFITRWVLVEMKSGLIQDSKLHEILVSNFKIMYGNTNEAKVMREFMIKVSTISGASDYLFSRIQDLYIQIQTEFPKSFINFIRIRHIETLKQLGYQVDDDVSNQFEFGWLLPRIQHIMRYTFEINNKDTKKKST